MKRQLLLALFLISGLIVNGQEDGILIDPLNKHCYQLKRDIQIRPLDLGIGHQGKILIVADGDTTRVEGAWTCVFRKENNDWKVIVSNGAHRGL